MDLRARAQELAEAHIALGPETEAIYWFPDSQEVRLLEVVTIAPTTYAIFPVSFGPVEDFPVPSSVLVVSPAEFEDLQAGALSPPVGWGVFASAERLHPVAA